VITPLQTRALGSSAPPLLVTGSAKQNQLKGHVPSQKQTALAKAKRTFAISELVKIDLPTSQLVNALEYLSTETSKQTT